MQWWETTVGSFHPVANFPPFPNSKNMKPMKLHKIATVGKAIWNRHETNETS